MIPHILHFIWLGGKPVPKIIKSWIDNHKNWEVKIWTEENLKLNYINNHINNIHKKRYNQKSDIIRLELLYRYGGVYVDTDILSIKNISKLLDNCDVFFIQEKLGLISNSIIGSIRKNNVILNIIKYININFDENIAVWKSTGPMAITNCLLKYKYIKIPKSHTNYDILSNINNLTIYPYYYTNFMQNTIKTCLNSPLNLCLISANKDKKYFYSNDINIKNIYALQLWFGGKSKNYEKIINENIIIDNLKLYLSLLQNNKF